MFFHVDAMNLAFGTLRGVKVTLLFSQQMGLFRVCTCSFMTVRYEAMAICIETM